MPGVPYPVTDDWVSGLVVLMSGDTLTGSILLDVTTDLLQVYHQGTLKTYTPAQVQTYFAQGAIHAPFVYARGGGRPQPVFFELVSVGPCLMLLARGYDPYDNPRRPEAGASPATALPLRGERRRFFIAPPGGVAQRVPRKRRTFAALFPPPIRQQVLEHMTTHRLRPTREADLRTTLLYYNRALRPCLQENR